jgi:protein-disulfide isomerase
VGATGGGGRGVPQLQGDEAFWGLHNLIFENQRDFTAANVHAKLSDLARTINALDAAEYQRCIANGHASAVVGRDAQFAAAHNIAATPTIFIDGKPAHRIRSAEQLWALLRQRTTPAADKTRPALP